VSDYDFELEEHQSQANKQILLRILRLMLPHWKWLVGFLVAVGVVAGLDSYFTYLSKQVIDTGIVAHNRQAVFQIFTIYGAMLLVQAVAVFAFIYLVSLMGERVRYVGDPVAAVESDHPGVADHQVGGRRVRAGAGDDGDRGQSEGGEQRPGGEKPESAHGG
jgi:hypothetical protein